MITMPDLQDLPWHDSDMYELIIDQSSATITSAIALCATPDDAAAAPSRLGWLVFHNAQLTSDPIQLPAISEETGVSAEILRIEWQSSTQIEYLFQVNLFVQLINEPGADRSFALLTIGLQQFFGVKLKLN